MATNNATIPKSPADKCFSRIVDGNKAQYDFVEKLGRGAFGVAQLFEVRRHVVLKKISLENPQFRNPKLLKLAENEAKVLAALCHPNIVRIYHAWTDLDANQIVMELEYCAGQSLKSLIRDNALNDRTKFDCERIVNWFSQMAVAVAYLHDSKIVHRDLKSDNILLSADTLTVKIADFGLAKLTADDSMMTMTGPVGTPTNLAPECYADYAQKSDPKVDIWALGVIAYEMATLELPYPSVENLFMVHYNPSLKPPRLGEIDPILRNLIDGKLLVVNPQNRADIHQVLEHPFICSETKDILENSNNYLHKQLISLREKNAENEVEMERMAEDLAMEVERNRKYLETTTAKQNHLQENEKRLLVKVAALEAMLKERGCENGFIVHAEQLQSQPQTPPNSLDVEGKASETEEDMKEELFEACHQGDTNRARSILQSEPTFDVNEMWLVRNHYQVIFPMGCTCLMTAAGRGNLDTVTMLLKEFDAKIDQQQKDGFSALHYAAYYGHLPVVRLLMECGAKLELRNCRGWTALIFAVMSGKCDVIEFILQNGADVAAKDSKGMTALAFADSENVKRLLTDYGATL